MTDDQRKDSTKQPPDGGWGWFVCLGSGLITLSLRAMEPSFGLLFEDLLEDLNVRSTGTAIIMGVLDVTINFSGFLVGPLLNKYSCRQVALFGSFLSSGGLILTSRANSMLYIICTYSILGGIGIGIATASSFVAVNTFFYKKRGQAVGFSMAGVTLAMIFLPQLIHILLDVYGFRGTMLIIGGCALHSIVGSCLLRPVQESSVQSPSAESRENNEKRESETLLTNKPDVARKMSNATMWTGNQHEENQMTVSKNKSFTNKIKAIFDLDLLKDSIYLSASIGCSLFHTAETNFKLTVPFFLSNIGMTKADIAFFLSLTAFSDIPSRLTLPILFDKFGWRKRVIFWIACLLLGIARSTLAEQSERIPLIVMFVIAGFLRGVALVNFNLCISESCSLKKLPNAFGIFMIIRGLFVVTLSPVLGYVRDVSSSYRLHIHLMTTMILVMIIAWSVEFSYSAYRKRRRATIQQLQSHQLE